MKPRYKRTILGEIPEDWNLKKLQEVAQINMGQSPKSSDCNDTGNGIPFFQGNADFGFKYPVCKNWTINPTKIALPDDILISVRAPVGSLNFANTKCCIGRGLCSITPQSNTNLFYLYYSLLYSIPRLLNKQQGSTFTAINKSDINTFMLPTPSFPEQQKIAEILSTVDADIEKTDAIIKETQQLKKGLMEKLFTEGIGHTRFKKTKIGRIPEEWEIQKLEMFCEKICVGFVGTCEKFYTEKEVGIIMLRTGNLQDGKLDLSDLKYVSKKFHLKNKKSQLAPCDLIIARHGSSGQSVLIPDNFEEANCLNIVIVRANKEYFIPKFLNYLFNCHLIKRQIDRNKAGSTQEVINTKEIAKTLFPCPSFAEQKEVINILVEVDTKIENEQNYKSELEQLKKGLLQVLLTGKVRVKV